MDMPEIKEGAEFVVEQYPFLRNRGEFEVFPWRPGVEIEPVHSNDYEPVCDGWGKLTLTVVSVHKPGRFSTRVFYTRKFTDPSGTTFGNNSLQIHGLNKFKRRASGYGAGQTHKTQPRLRTVEIHQT